MKKFTEREIDLSNQIKKLLLQDEVFKFEVIETACNIPKTTLYRCCKHDKNIPVQHLFALIRFLAKYGLKIDDYSIIADDETPNIYLQKQIPDREIEDREVRSEKGGIHFEYIMPIYRNMASEISDLL